MWVLKNITYCFLSNSIPTSGISFLVINILCRVLILLEISIKRRLDTKLDAEVVIVL